MTHSRLSLLVMLMDIPTMQTSKCALVLVLVHGTSLLNAYFRMWLNHNFIQVTPLLPLFEDIKQFLDSTTSEVTITTVSYTIPVTHMHIVQYYVTDSNIRYTSTSRGILSDQRRYNQRPSSASYRSAQGYFR